MPSYKEPSFQERTALANKAKQAAVAQLRAVPPIDDATLAARRVAAEARAAAQEKVRAEKLAARILKKEQKEEQARQNALPVAPAAPSLTAEEQKAARDERYAARKMRKGKK
jgi:hypothetical protein